jgi:hypothetical protein
MAITLTANLAKKVPLPGINYGSLHASISITAEITDLAQVHAEAQRLYHLAEQAIDAQLALPGHPEPHPVGGTAPSSASTSGSVSAGTPAGGSAHAAAARPAAVSVASQATATVPSSNAGRGRPDPGAQSRPYRPQGRRAPAPVTQSQLAYLGRLLEETRTPLDPILETYQIGALADLSCRQAAELIDQLKAGSGAGSAR